MDRNYEELEEVVHVEIEKLREEIKTKAVVYETLKRAHNEQLGKLQETNLKVENQARELNDKEAEINATKLMHEELKSVVIEKESLIKHLSSSNCNLRTNFNERLTQLEVEKKEIVEKLEEANLKILEKEKDLNTYKEEITCLKSHLSALENKCLESEKRAKASKELGQRDNMLSKLEEDSRKVEDQFKWKKEQFKHLEEAHEILRGDFKTSQKQRDMEKSNLLEEMYKLQEKLDSQTRISEDLQGRLQTCHQALAHEESRRKVLELQFSETKTNFDSVLSECEEAKMEIELLTGQRDKEIASLRDSLGKKEMVYKDMEYRVRRLEQENEELRISVKEFQEAQIHEKGASSSLSKLQNKLKAMERTHKDSLKDMKAKESEWSAKLERMDEDLLSYKTELEQKRQVIKELEINCEGLDRIHRDCAKNLQAKELDWGSQLQKVFEDLTDCKSELERKDEFVKELEMKYEGLYRAHEGCSLKYSSEEAQWTAKVNNMAEDLVNLRNELEGKDGVIRELEMKCEALDQVHRDCSSKIKNDEDQWTTQLENMSDDLGKCKTELKRKDEVIRDLEMKCEALDRVHRDYSSKLKYDEEQRTTQLEKMFDDLDKCKTELEVKDEVIKDLKIKCEALDHLNRDCSIKFASKESEWNLLSVKMEEDVVGCQTELESKDEVIKELNMKLEILDHLYRDCSSVFKAKEAEWASQSENFARDLSDCRNEFELKNDAVKQLKAEMEGKDEVMKELQMALEDSISSNIRLELQNEEKSLMLIVFKAVISDMNLRINERVEEVSLYRNQIERKSEEISSLSKKIESLIYVKNELETDLMKVRNALKQANEDLVESNELEFELHVWRSNAERLSENLDEYKNTRKDLEASLLRQIEVEESLKHEKENLVSVVEEKEKQILRLVRELKDNRNQSGNEKQKAFYKSLEEIENLEQELLSRELECVIVAHMNAERVSEQEKEDFCRIVREKDQKIGRKQEELNRLLKAWEKIATDELAKEVEIQEKALVIAELECDLENLQMRFDLKLKDLFGEIEELKSSLQNSEVATEKLESEKRNLLAFIGSLSKQISSLSVEDMKLASFWERIEQHCANEVDELYDPSKENTSLNSPLTKKSVEATVVDGRSPLRALNSLMRF